MATHDNDELIQEKMKKLVENLPEHRPSAAKRTEFIARLYRVSEERKQVLELVPVRRIAVGVALVTLIVSFNFLFSPLYPTVSNVKGTVKIYRSGSNEWIFADKSNIKLYKNDIIKTFPDGQADLIIPNLYHMRLKNDSEVRLSKAPIRALSQDIGYTLSKGKVFAHYNKSRRIGKELGIETPQAIATALGTAFMVESAPLLDRTMVGVLDGVVRVNTLESAVLVRAGERTTIQKGESPLAPTRLMENELLDMEELYNIGTRPQVALLISTGPTRTRELLSVVPIFVVSDAPDKLPEKIESIVKEFNQAIKEKSKEKHIENIMRLEEIVNQSPNPKYDVQFLLFIGAYYAGLGEDAKAIATFERVVNSYPKSSMASIAQCAIGIIYEEKLKDAEKARAAYQKVISDYTQSPEAEEASSGLSRLAQ